MNISKFETGADHEKSPTRMAGLRFLSNFETIKRQKMTYV